MKKRFGWILGLWLVTAPAFGTELATFAGGCFWCMESEFEELSGIQSVVSGYSGGRKENPTYEEVSSGTTEHAEVVQITFDPKKVSYEKLLEIFWSNVDPTDAGGQFVDRGSQYRSAVFYHSEEQRKLAEASRAKLGESGRFKGKKIVTEITAASKFYAAEEHHQDFYKKSPLRYKAYRFGSGRDQFLKETWGKKH